MGSSRGTILLRTFLFAHIRPFLQHHLLTAGSFEAILFELRLFYPGHKYAHEADVCLLTVQESRNMVNIKEKESFMR